jgi:hypothetical protein
MVTLHVMFVPSKISDHWLVDHDDLLSQLIQLMPDVKRYTSSGFKQYKWYKVEHITRCYDNDIPGALDGCNVIELTVIPKNL